MAVVINEFEVVAEPPHNGAAGGKGAGAAEHGAPNASSTARDIERVVRRMHERAARVRAS